MTKTRLILILALLLTFAAGASLGYLVGNKKAPAGRWSRLAAELDLTKKQQEQMEKIWSEGTGQSSRDPGGKRAALQRQRDQDILALIPEEKRNRYELIQEAYSTQMDALSKERRAAFDRAVEETKKILTPEQAKKYEELMKEHRDRRGSGGRGAYRRPTTATAPASDESSPRVGE